MTGADVSSIPAESLLAELAALGMLSPAELVSNVIEFEEVSMSHAAYRLSVDGVVRAFVKRSDPVRSQGRDLGTEATLYRLAAYELSLAQVIPRCLAVSPDDTLVVLEVLPTPDDGAPWSLFGPVHEGAAGHPALRAYGRAVATAHSVRPAPFGEAPWLLHALESRWGDDQRLPPSVRRLFRHVAGQPVFRRGFATALAAWQPVALVHGDLRWANVLHSTEGQPRVWLVDWELSCLGDPAWDVGSVLADIVASATAAIREVVPQRRLLDSAVPFLSAYRSVARPGLESWTSLLARSTLFAGIRLVQTISEYGHLDPSEMDAIEPLLLPWSAEMMRPGGQMSLDLLSAVGS